MISIITPTYNRGHLLDAAYRSLLRQSNKDFVWIIVDDGGTDNTEGIVRPWIAEGKIKIIYEHQENGGVNRARNRGFKLAQGEIVTFLDDDDYFSDDAVETIYHYWPQIKDNPKIAGLFFLCGYQKTGEIIGDSFRDGVAINNYIKIYYGENLTGDKFVIHKTEVQRKYPFPTFDGEKFAPEAIMFGRIAREYDYLCVNKILIYKEYLEDGISKNYPSESGMITGLLTWHRERMDKAYPYRIRQKSMRKWIRLKLQMKASLFSIFREAKDPWLSLLCFPGALITLFTRFRETKGVSKAQKDQTS